MAVYFNSDSKYSNVDVATVIGYSYPRIQLPSGFGEVIELW